MSSSRARVIDAARRYWTARADLVEALPVPTATRPSSETLPPALAQVKVPEWAASIGVDGVLIVPAWTMTPGGGEDWTRCDWWRAAEWFLDGAAERAHESQFGVVGSYSSRLRGWDSRWWERAWVNRMAMLLRRWASRTAGIEERALGEFPGAELVLTFDLDAVRKTIAIRGKQTVFHAVNVLRLAGRGAGGQAVKRLQQGAQFAATSPSYDLLDRAVRLAGSRRGTIYAFAGGSRTALARFLIDPSYQLDGQIAGRLSRLARDGWTIGLHPSFDCWREPVALRAARTRLEQAISAPVTSCRQHWLRFSWSATWQAQQQAGFRSDSTLGFNDRPAFRTGAALEYIVGGGNETLTTLPLMLMDSHVYDYGLVAEGQRGLAMAKWIDEVLEVGGRAAVLWHPHTLAPDYGWEPGLQQLIAMMARPARA